MKKILFMVIIALGIMVMTNSNPVNAKTKATYKNGVVTVTGKGKFTSRKYQKNKKVQKVIVGKNVTKIGNYAFKGCKNLKKVSFNKKLKAIGKEAFKGTALKKVDLPVSVKKIGDGAFFCVSLKELKMPGKMHWSYSEIENCIFFSCVDKVIFKTSVDYHTMLGVPAKEYVVSAKDKKYVSIDGAIYRKNDYQLMMIPRVKEFTVSEQCKILDLYHIYHFRYLCDDDYFETNYELEKLIIPVSVNKIIYTRPENYDGSVEFYDSTIDLKVEVLNKNLDDVSMKNLEQWKNDFLKNREMFRQILQANNCQ